MDNLILQYLQQNPDSGRKTISNLFNISERKAREIVKKFKQSKQSEKNELENYALKLQLKNQKLLDQNRIERKIRDEYRSLNHLKELTDQLVNCFNGYQNKTIKHETINGNHTGIIQLSDLHLGEEINLKHNQYNFNVASKRLKKLAIQVKKIFNAYDIKHVLISLTGDCFSALKHADQLVSYVTSRANSVFIASNLLEQFILDLNQDFNISCCCVAGNESRDASQEIVPSNNMLMSDNLDISLFNILKIMFRNTDVRFLDTNIIDCVVKIYNHNFLFTHGHTFSHQNLQKSIQELKGKYAIRNMRISHVIFGHIHNSYVSSDAGFFRSGSLCGDNSYSFNLLNYSGKASQNICIVSEKSVNGISLDLQDVENVIGYDFDQSLIEKTNQHRKIEINIM